MGERWREGESGRERDEVRSRERERERERESEVVGVAARVWKSSSFGAPVAVKRWRENTAGFTNELTSLLLLSHPRIVRLFSALSAKETLFLEWADRGDLLQFGLKWSGNSDKYREKVMKHIPRWARELGEALSAVHAVGLIHYDVKPANVLLSPSLSLILADFSHALFTGTDPALFPSLSPSVGTLEYAAPEALATGERQRVTPLSDSYAAGMTLWSTASVMETPFAERQFRSAAEAAAVVVTERPQVNSGWPEDWRRFFARIWAKKADKRLSSRELALVELSDITGRGG